MQPGWREAAAGLLYLRLRPQTRQRHVEEPSPGELPPVARILVAGLAVPLWRLLRRPEEVVLRRKARWHFCRATG